MWGTEQVKWCTKRKPDDGDSVAVVFDAIYALAVFVWIRWNLFQLSGFEGGGIKGPMLNVVGVG